MFFRFASDATDLKDIECFTDKELVVGCLDNAKWLILESGKEDEEVVEAVMQIDIGKDTFTIKDLVVAAAREDVMKLCFQQCIIMAKCHGCIELEWTCDDVSENTLLVGVAKHQFNFIDTGGGINNSGIRHVILKKSLSESIAPEEEDKDSLMSLVTLLTTQLHES